MLPGIPGIAFVYFSDQDVVRHELVQRIIQAYERMGAEAGPLAGGGKAARPPRDGRG
jgi:phosphate starvation-inducible protein PhoH